MEQYIIFVRNAEESEKVLRRLFEQGCHGDARNTSCSFIYVHEDKSLSFGNSFGSTGSYPDYIKINAREIDAHLPPEKIHTIAGRGYRESTILRALRGLGLVA